MVTPGEGVKMPFSPEVKERMFIRCIRFCCLCLKHCGTNIEAAHIVDEHADGSNEEENGIPVCLDCHQEIGAYNDKHPKGNKFRPGELRTRRDKVYGLVESGRLHAFLASKSHLGQGGAVGQESPESNSGASSKGAGAPEKSIDPSSLPDLEFKILVVVGKQRRVTAREVALAVHVTEEKAKFYLDELVRKHELIDWYGNMNPRGADHYMLRHEGRRLLVERKVFE
jgi:hypothetical protein